MSSEIAIQVRNLSKCYHIYDAPRDRLKQFIMPRLARLAGAQPRQYFKEFWALKNVSFEIHRGETVGIIGRNGSGKSTLLQMICGTLNPSGGSIETHGRIAALLELGSGFNPEFTGRENVYLNGAVLGLTRQEIDARFDDILAFADIGGFVDQPVKTYSSGMMVRLAFAVQAQSSPDILVVDEALAVGDAKFQAKCFERLKQLKENGTSILLVTHSSEQIVTHCSRAVLLDRGDMIQMGQPKTVVNRYLDLLFGKERLTSTSSTDDTIDPEQLTLAADTHKVNCFEDVFNTRPGYNPHEYRWGDGAAKVLDYCLWADGEAYPTAIETGQSMKLDVAIKMMQTLHCPILGITVKTKEGVTVYGVNSETLSVDAFREFGGKNEVAIAHITFACRLAPGDYFISLGVATSHGGEIIPHDRRYDAIHLQVQPSSDFFGLVNLGMQLEVEKA